MYGRGGLHQVSGRLTLRVASLQLQPVKLGHLQVSGDAAGTKSNKTGRAFEMLSAFSALIDGEFFLGHLLH